MSYYIAEGKRVDLGDVKNIYIPNGNIPEAVLSEDVESVWCSKNQIKELVLPHGIEDVWRSIIPKNLKQFINKRLSIKIIIHLQ